MTKPNFALGLDSSTQSLSAVLIDVESQSIHAEMSLNFDQHFPNYKTVNGTLPHKDPKIVHAPPLMWVEALDKLFYKMQQEAWPLDQVGVIAGSGQQHGTVYLNETADVEFSCLKAEQSLVSQLQGIFSRSTAPIWMDSSTAIDCEVLSEVVGANELANSTGSFAYERFSGPQIRKFYREEPQAYAETKSICLVSSFLASILAGKIAPIDLGDASGMNLLDLKSRSWNRVALEACAPKLADRLGTPVPSDTVFADIAPYFSEKYGVHPQAKVMAWSGDNPNSLIGLGLTEAGDMALSLGTSDVLFTLMKELPKIQLSEGHVFYTPKNDFMGLLCFSNGSLVREKIKDHFLLNWSAFEKAVAASPIGNKGGMMLPWFIPEIIPKVTQPNVVYEGIDSNDAPQVCRAVLEGQMLSRLIHAENLGVSPKCLKITGGASKNQSIVQIAADVFGCPIESIESTASAALGAALRAMSAMQPTVPLKALVEPFVKVVQTTLPVSENHQMYKAIKQNYREFEQKYVK